MIIASSGSKNSKSININNCHHNHNNNDISNNHFSNGINKDINKRWSQKQNIAGRKTNNYEEAVKEAAGEASALEAECKLDLTSKNKLTLRQFCDEWEDSDSNCGGDTLKPRKRGGDKKKERGRR